MWVISGRLVAAPGSAGCGIEIGVWSNGESCLGILLPLGEQPQEFFRFCRRSCREIDSLARILGEIIKFNTPAVFKELEQFEIALPDGGCSEEKAPHNTESARRAVEPVGRECHEATGQG